MKSFVSKKELHIHSFICFQPQNHQIATMLKHLLNKLHTLLINIHTQIYRLSFNI